METKFNINDTALIQVIIKGINIDKDVKYIVSPVTGYNGLGERPWFYVKETKMLSDLIKEE